MKLRYLKKKIAELPKHTILCDCRKCVRNHIRYYAHLEEDLEREGKDMEVINKIYGELALLTERYELDDPNVIDALIEAFNYGMDYAKKEFEALHGGND